MLILIFSFLISSSFAVDRFSCEATYGELNIPKQETKSLEEFYYCFGFHHARDRAWEMDYFRRAGQGRNAEVLGFSQLKSDLMMRLLDLPELAEKIWNGFSQDQKKWLELYSEGANAGFKIGKNAKEFIDKDFSPEPWAPQDSLLVLLLQSFDQTRKTFFRDYEEEKAKEKWGKDTERLFNEDNVPWESTILKEGEYVKAPVKQTTSVDRRMPKLWGEFPTVFGHESGSNNWVIDRKKSKTGHAILANDPHLDLKTPMFWYWIHMTAPGIKVVGASVPGVPVIPSGTNGKTAWGLTNSYLNTADVFFVNDLKDHDIESFRPTVYIKWWIFKIPFFFKSFERLKSGHKVLPLETERDEKIVLRWSGYSLSPDDIYPMFEIFKMENVTKMDELLSRVGVPSWNLVYADTQGDIGYHMIGKAYRSTEKNAYGVAEKSYADLGKEEFLSVEEKPHLLKPKRGYISTANNRHWPKDAKFYGGRGYSYAFRNFRIDELLRGQHDMESFKAIQCDEEATDARFFLPKILKNLSIPELKDWGMVASDQSKEAPLYRRMMDLMLEKWEVNEYALFNLLDELSPQQKNELEEIYQMAKEEVGDRVWGDIHRLNFPHLSKNESWSFAEDIAGVGDNHSINPGTSKWNSSKKIFEQYSGASMRLIIEMSNPVKIELVLPGLNREYTERPTTSPWQSWKKCQYTPVTF